ncbi:GIY-YIG nuclease family protein [Staphylococcus equorum]|uniref:GIY-YIG nuclease family protein n=2 Tax=Staphylococcus equorum TaxID=246432 RepID=UPI003EBEFD22
MTRKKTIKINEVLENDPLGLLDLEEEVSRTYTTEEERLIASFNEISDFYEENNREPGMSRDLDEFALQARLNAIKSSPDKVRLLLPYDFYKMLQEDETKSVSIEDILKDDPLNIFGNDEIDKSIFELKHVEKNHRMRPDHISRRRVCENFEVYEKLFLQIHTEIKENKRKLVEFKSEHLEAGNYFVLNGVLLYLEEEKSEKKELEFTTGKRIRRDGRTKCIFDNGTESNMLLRSLEKALNIDGFSISNKISRDYNVNRINDDDRMNGFIYVLRSLSEKQEISSMDNLFKIGYCSGDVTERIKNAVNEPTYLMSEVEVVMTVRCFNISLNSLEFNVHNFFNEVNVSVEIEDNNDKIHRPREWYSAPLPVIEEAINLIVNDEIQNYLYDKELETIIIKG